MYTAAVMSTLGDQTRETLALEEIMRIMQPQLQQRMEQLQVQLRAELRELRESERIGNSRLSESRTSADAETPIHKV